MSNGSAGVAASSLSTPCTSDPVPGIVVKATDIKADFTWSGVQSGCTARSSAPEPAVCGLDIEVPLMMLYSGGPPGMVPSGEWKAARMSTPGAVTSGLMTPGTDGLAPRELNEAITSPLAGFSS